jgi:outer membrane protein TolC
MSKETVSNPARPTVSAGTEQASKGARAQDRIAQRAYELYEQRGRQDGRALEDWLSAERQLVGASGKS